MSGCAGRSANADGPVRLDPQVRQGDQRKGHRQQVSDAGCHAGLTDGRPLNRMRTASQELDEPQEEHSHEEYDEGHRNAET
jgi:hypothetical protein